MKGKPIDFREWDREIVNIMYKASGLFKRIERRKGMSAEGGVNLNNLSELKECRALMDKVIRDVEKRVGLKDTRRKRV